MFLHDDDFNTTTNSNTRNTASISVEGQFLQRVTSENRDSDLEFKGSKLCSVVPTREPGAFNESLKKAYNFLAMLQSGKLLRNREIDCYDPAKSAIDPLDLGFVGIEQKRKLLSAFDNHVREGLRYYVKLDNEEDSSEPDETLKFLAADYCGFLDNEYDLEASKQLTYIRQNGIKELRQEVEKYESSPLRKIMSNLPTTSGFLTAFIVLIAFLALKYNDLIYKILDLHLLNQNTTSGQEITI